ncbi:MAG: HAD-IIIA family hydrolase [Candidatus Eisenbacteria bacterium]|nr:HAD-IIIA family hydrolase [Candidatus Latescibacterota bacterium]MBD3301171.1 HAD-IIIA family hydrolase [Candidatus Eisenbacteria bacterium]
MAPEAESLRYRGILWDLDGTLVETREDIAAAVNGALAERKLPPMPLEAVIRNVGHGSRYLMARCLERSGVAEATAEQVDGATEAFVRHYLDHLLDRSKPYPGIPEMLGRLQDAGAEMAVVSNKPQEPAVRLVEGLGLASRFRLILGMGPNTDRKPHPGMLLEAIDRLEAPLESCVLVGDSPVDVEASRAAGIASVAVAWGFRSEAELRATKPDLLAVTVAELEGWLRG